MLTELVEMLLKEMEIGIRAMWTLKLGKFYCQWYFKAAEGKQCHCPAHKRATRGCPEDREEPAHQVGAFSSNLPFVLLVLLVLAILLAILLSTHLSIHLATPGSLSPGQPPFPWHPHSFFCRGISSGQWRWTENLQIIATGGKNSGGGEDPPSLGVPL